VPDQLLTVLRICLLILVWLFFLRVLRAVWSEVAPPAAPPQPAPAAAAGGRAGRGRARPARATKPTRTSRRRPTGPPRLVAVEPATRAGTAYDVSTELTVGRAPGCSIVLDEQYVSQVHARVFVREDQVFVEDLGSTNGTWVNGSRAMGQMPARPGDRIQIGNVVMEVR
jgi:hypothetical protein